MEVDDKFQNHIQASYFVETNDPTDGPIAVVVGAQAAGPDPLPAQWSTYSWPGESDTSIFLKRFSVRRRHQEKRRTSWQVTCHWSPVEPGQLGDNEQNPLLRPVRYHLEHAIYTELFTKDKDGNPILNSANMPFPDALEDEAARPILVARKNFATLQEIINLNLAFANRTNSSPYRGGAPRMWRCHYIDSGEQLLESGVEYYGAAIRIELNTKTWRKSVADQGMKHFQNAGDELAVMAKDKHGHDVNEPVNLEPDGTRRDDNLPGLFKDFDILGEVDFAGLGV